MEAQVKRLRGELNESKTLNKDNIQPHIKFLEKALEGEKKVGRYYKDVGVWANDNNDGIIVSVVMYGKRGRVGDAILKALSYGKPQLPIAYEYKYPYPTDGRGKKVTAQTIKADDERYDDRGYTDSEYQGAVEYTVVLA